MRRGSTKSHTYQVYRGKQVTKDRVDSVANPQSTLQMQQRLKLVGVANAAAQLKGIIDHSFEGVAYGYHSIAEFRKLNLSAKDLKIESYVPKGLTDLGLANYIVAKGSLPVLTPKAAAYDAVTYAGAFTISNNNAGDNTISRKASSGADALVIAQTEDNMKAICGILGIEEGAQLTLLLQVYDAEKAVDVYKPNGSTSFYDRSSFFVCRLITDYTDENFMKGWVFDSDDESNIIKNSSLGLILNASDTESPAEFTLAHQPNVAGWGSLESTQVIAAAAIQSKKGNDGWQRSNSRLTNVMLSEDSYALWPFADAESTYQKGLGASTLYLNQGSNVNVDIIPNE